MASTPLEKRLNQHIAWLDKRIAEIDTDLTQRLRQSDIWSSEDELLSGIPGVGGVTTLTLLAKRPEPGKPNRHVIAVLTGVAPLDNESGDNWWNRFI